MGLTANDPPPAQCIEVVGAVIVTDDRCLVAQRSASMSLPLKWEFPGGKLEPGETRQAALARELAEELAVTVEVSEYLGSASTRRGHRVVDLHLYAVTIVRGTPVAREHAELRWVSALELPELDLADVDRELLPPVTRLLNG